jgi:hypothetical protein
MAALPLLDFNLLPESGSGISLSSESYIRVRSTFRRLMVRVPQFQIQRSCCKDLMEVRKLLIDVGRIRHCARHFVLFVRQFRCGRGDEFLEARIVPERIEHWIEPE